MGHIQLSRSADLVLVCPATADLIARMAGGIANDPHSVFWQLDQEFVLLLLIHFLNRFDRIANNVSQVDRCSLEFPFSLRHTSNVQEIFKEPGDLF